MSSKRKIRGNINLTKWDLVKTSNEIQDIKQKSEKKIESAIEELFYQFCIGGKLEDMVSKAAGEALTYAARDGLCVDFFKSKYKAEKIKPGEMLVEVSFSDYDHFVWKESFYENIKETVDAWKDDDGYASEEMEREFLAVAKQFKKCAEILELSIRPKGKIK